MQASARSLTPLPVHPVQTHTQTYFARHAAAVAAGRAVPPPMPSFVDMVRRDGMVRLWRGSPAVLLGCIPSHAAYFTAYEAGRDVFGLNVEGAGHQPFASASTGALATILHDGILTPMDVVKQRLQLGYYTGLGHCLRSIVAEEGWPALWRSYPTTLLMNIPYAAAVVAANESFKTIITPFTGRTSMLTYLLAGAGAGAIAAAATCPLDIIKTRLQTAAVMGCDGPTGCGDGKGPAGIAAPRVPGSGPSLLGGMNVAVSHISQRGGAPLPGPLDVARTIWRAEGVPGFFRGVRARMAVHTPSQAISWATYEGIRGMLVRTAVGDRRGGDR